jgi:hypothetical protein
MPQNVQICRVRLDHIDCNSLKLSLFHNICGHVVNEQPDGLYCSFCEVACQNGCTHGFQLHLTIADDSEKVFAWCLGQTAVEFLQISPDEYMELPEVLTCQPIHHSYNVPNTCGGAFQHPLLIVYRTTVHI